MHDCTTAQGTSRMSAAQEIFWMIGYMVFQPLVWGGTRGVFAKAVRKGLNPKSLVANGRQPAHIITSSSCTWCSRFRQSQIDRTITGWLGRWRAP